MRDPDAQVWEVVEWDVVDNDILGAYVRCPDCPCVHGEGCDGDGQLHMPYALPGGARIDTFRDADLLIQILDREAALQPLDPDIPVGDQQWLLEPGDGIGVREFLAGRAIRWLHGPAARRGRKNAAELVAEAALWAASGDLDMGRAALAAALFPGSDGRTTFMGPAPDRDPRSSPTDSGD